MPDDGQNVTEIYNIIINNYEFVVSKICNLSVNPLKTKRRLFYINPQSVPRSKHFSSWL